MKIPKKPLNIAKYFTCNARKLNSKLSFLRRSHKISESLNILHAALEKRILISPFQDGHTRSHEMKVASRPENADSSRYLPAAIRISSGDGIHQSKR